MSVTVHPGPGQSMAGLARVLLAMAEHPRDVRPVTGGRPGYLVPDEVAHAYLSAELGVIASAVGTLAGPFGPLPPIVDGRGPEAESAADATNATPADDAPAAAPEPKRGPGRPRKTAPPAKTAEPTAVSKEVQ